MSAVNALAPDTARASRYSAKTYAAFRVSDGRTDRLRLNAPASLTAAVGDAQLLCLHKETLLIRETDEETGAVKLHLYAIKRRSAPDYVHEGFVTRRVQRLYAEKLCEIDGAVLR